MPTSAKRGPLDKNRHPRIKSKRNDVQTPPAQKVQASIVKPNEIMTTPYLLTGLGAAFGVSLSCLGSASASTMAASYAMTSKGMMSHVPIIISGVLGIYGLIIGVILAGILTGTAEIEVKQGCANLAAGLAVGLSCYASGMGIFSFLANSLYGDDYMTRRQQENGGQLQVLLTKPDMTPMRTPYPVTTKFVLMLAFLEALGLYGLIVALTLIGYQ